MAAIRLCCCLFLLSIPCAVLAVSVDDVSLHEALQLEPDAEVMYYLPDYLQRLGPDEYRNQVFAALDDSASSYTLFRGLAALCLTNVDYRRIPQPDEEAFREFCSVNLYAGLDYDAVFGNWDAANRGTAMRAALRTALHDSDDYDRIFYAIQLAPVFFGETELGEWYEQKTLKAIAWSTYCERNYELPNDRRGRQRLALRKWTAALWRRGDEARREELIQAFYLDPLSEADYREHGHEDLIPVHQWLAEHPTRLRELLAHEQRLVRQETLRLALLKQDQAQPALLPLDEPCMINALIEGLEDDWIDWNHYGCFQALAKNPEIFLPALRKKFAETTDGQQKAMLCDLLVFLNNADGENSQVLQYLYELLGTREFRETDFCWAPPGYYYSQRYIWAAQRLEWLVDKSTKFLVEQLAQTHDPQQAALTVLLLNHRGRGHVIEWNRKLIEQLARGLQDNNVRFDLGLCVAALKCAPRNSTNDLTEIALNKNDTQLNLVVSVLLEFLGGNMEFYQLLYRDAIESYDENQQHRYWEFDYAGSDPESWREGSSSFEKHYSWIMNYDWR